MYNPATPYPVFFGGGGCGGANPVVTGDGFGVGATNAILVGMGYIGGCFSDGGTSCATSIAKEPNCVNEPELPYFRNALAWVESHFCVDRAKVFVGGYSSGGWESLTLGCGGANLIRGTVSDEGGKREHRQACTGPVAMLAVGGEADTTNPIGPLTTINQDLDSYGSAPAVAEVLVRNGCYGTLAAASAAMPSAANNWMGQAGQSVGYDPTYPACVTFPSCPKAFPVVWCPLPGAGHNNSSVGTLNYSPGNAAGDPLMWKFLSNLPPP